MIEWLQGLSPVWQALVGTGFTWSVTALGAGVVFFSRASIARSWMACWALPLVS